MANSLFMVESPPLLDPHSEANIVTFTLREPHTRSSLMPAQFKLFVQKMLLPNIQVAKQLQNDRQKQRTIYYDNISKTYTLPNFENSS